jgi:hypothetical protein
MPRKMPAPADAPKPRGRPSKTHNQESSDAALQSQLKEVRRLKLTLDEKTAAQRTANGAYRSAIKVAVACGKHLDLAAKDVTGLMDLMDREPEDIDRETNRMNRLAILMALPIGTQLGLWSDEDDKPASVASMIEKGSAPDYDPTPDEEAGYLAFGKKSQRDDNPHDTDAHRHHAWERGFMKAEQDFLALERSGV